MLIAEAGTAACCPLCGSEVVPAPLPVTDQYRAAEMAAQLGLPAGITVWSVELRQFEDGDDLRLWLHRTLPVPEGLSPWLPNTVAATRWHPKLDWKSRASVAEILSQELHLAVDVGREWSSGEHGRRRLYELAVVRT
jgi:hypothetical protein